VLIAHPLLQAARMVARVARPLLALVENRPEAGAIGRSLAAEASALPGSLARVRRLILLQSLSERCFDERIQVAVEHGLGIAALHARPKVFHELIGLQHV